MDCVKNWELVLYIACIASGAYTRGTWDLLLPSHSPASSLTSLPPHLFQQIAIVIGNVIPIIRTRRGVCSYGLRSGYNPIG